ncbi:MAG: hypothetical protein JEY96_06550 [Bacteroidales bacterium]|nr:hypothetical protein [Bacteroidales bacterium]
MRKIIVITLLLFVCFNSYSQDKIIRTNGDQIRCKILSEDSLAVSFTYYYNSKLTQTHLNKTEISSIEYGKKSKDKKSGIANFGIGFGLDYGGLGMNLLLSPNKHIGVFGGLGYAFAGFGYNVGVKLSLAPDSRVCPYIQGMYGYNAVIYIKDQSSFDKFFYGETVGFGLDFKSKNGNGGWSIAVLYPFRKDEVKEYMDDLKENEYVEFENELYPVTISIGLRF